MAVGEEGVVCQSAEAVVVPPDTGPLAKQTFAYGLSGLIGPVVGLITLPIFARALTQGQYGLLELGTTTTTVALARHIRFEADFLYVDSMKGEIGAFRTKLDATCAALHAHDEAPRSA